nr:hypothetical protein [Candidatus Synechococcus spongiarum]
MGHFFKQFSFPDHIGSRCTPETPGSIHEGGELGYVLSHACGSVFDNPELSPLPVWVTGKRRPAPWPPPGTSTSFSIPSVTWPCCRFCI